MRLFILLLSITFTLTLLSCTQNDPAPSSEFEEEGFVKGKITGLTKDGSYTFNDDFNFTKYSTYNDYQASYIVRGDTALYFSLTRSDYSTGNVNIGFWLPTNNNTQPYNLYLNIGYTKETLDKLIQFSMTSSDARNTLVITGFSFDQSTGKVKGKYSLTGRGSYSGKDATVVGDFEVTAKKKVN